MNETSLPQWVLERFPQDRNGLLNLLCDEISEELLLEIANCDYGFGVHENMEVFHQILRDRQIDRGFDWHPLEVLSLTRWLEPPDHNLVPNVRAREGHLKRAFSCQCLLLSMIIDPVREGEEDDLVQLFVSCRLLGERYSELLARFLASCLDELPDHSNLRTLAPFALLILCLDLQTESSEANFEEMIKYMEDREVATTEYFYGPDEKKKVFWKSSSLGLLFQKWHRLAFDARKQYGHSAPVSEYMSKVIAFTAGRAFSGDSKY